MEPRDASRLLVLPRSGGASRHLRFDDLPDLLAPGDLLVLNDTRVIPARLVGRKASGGRVEVLLVEPLAGRRRASRPAGWPWPRRRSPSASGPRLDFDGLGAEVVRVEGEGFYEVRFDRDEAGLEAALERVGRIPLPPYIRREPDAGDRERYQTVVAREPGERRRPHRGPPLHARAPGAGSRRGASRGPP